MRPKQWLLSAFLVPLVVVAQQPQRFLPGRLVQPPPAVNSRLLVRGRALFPSPPPFVTSPSFSFDNPGPTAESPRATRPTVSTAAFRPRARPVIRPVSDVQLQNFRPNSRFLRLPIRPRGRQTTSRPAFPTQPPPAPPPTGREHPPAGRPADRRSPNASGCSDHSAAPSAARPGAAGRHPAAPAVPDAPIAVATARPAAPNAAGGPVPFSADDRRSPTAAIAVDAAHPTPPTAALDGRRPAAAVGPHAPAQPLPPPTVPFAPPLPSRRPIPPTVGLNTPTGLRVAPRPRTPPGAHPPSVSPPDNATIQELNSAQDFMQVANRLSLQRRFARHRHRNRRHADFIERQQKKQQ
ncbi:hypothetical protein M3Y99_00802200 [Aphelenchoides fujianensis]|nr:hypothetical protein M3Y99_00802200 [Aphelenchoides fujianensis]